MINNIFITLQNCGCQGSKELRVAFGDLNNCQLKCPFCFTLEQQSSSDVLSSLRSCEHLDIVKIIRFTGGEPFISQEQIDGMIEELTILEHQNLRSLDLVVLQTNGLTIEKKDLIGFSSINLPLLFEVSFKGTTIKEYEYLTFKEVTAKEIASKLMDGQHHGYQHISSLFRSTNNIAVLARLGIFHSSVNVPTFKFIFPETTNLMFAPDKWDERMREVLKDQVSIWNGTYENKLVVEKLKTPADGSPGMGRRYRAIIDTLKAKKMIEEKKASLPKIFGMTYFYKRGNEIYWRAAKKLANKRMHSNAYQR